MQLDRIRNFCIVAHIDHGKSTLADRLLELTGALDPRQMRAQVLDSNELERERGITIKLHAVRMDYTARDGERYQLNLIDTPGHVDFTYEVSRSLAACEGAILVVDASQGVQAQTISNLFLALDADLEVIPVINKIDLPGAEPERRRDELADLLGVDPSEVLFASAKQGTGAAEILEAVIERVPPPEGDPEAPLRALIFDSYYDQYLGAVPSVRVVDGVLRPGMDIGFGTVDATYEVTEVGYTRLARVRRDALHPGEVGYLVAAIKSVSHTRVGDTVVDASRRATELLPGYKDVRPMVFAGLYPSNADDYESLRDALDRLKLNDGSLHYEPETSAALGFGFRCGFLGLLHMEIVQERLDREFGVSLITTVPNVEYHVTLTDGSELAIENPTRLPARGKLKSVAEPWVQARIMSPAEYIGNVQKLCHDRRGTFKAMQLPGSAAGGDGLRAAPGRDRPGLLRPPQGEHPRLRIARLRVRGVPAREPGEAGCAGERRSRRCLQRHHPPRPGAALRPRPGAQAEGTHPAPAVPGGAAGGDRIKDRGAHQREGPAQGGDRQVLRRGYHAQAQAARTAERREAADEAGGIGRDPAGGVSGRALD